MLTFYKHKEDNKDDHVGPTTEAVLTGDAERLLQRAMDDIAKVRSDTGTFSFTSVSPSAPDAMTNTTDFLKYVQATFGEKKFERKEDDVPVDEEGEDVTIDDEDSTSEKEQAGEPDREPRKPELSAESQNPARVPRGAEPSSEFEQNGLILMELFRRAFPVIRHIEDEFFPLNSKGTIPTKQMRHALLQFTCVAARMPHLIFLHANQVQRHAVLHTVVARASQEDFIEFTDLVNHKDFPLQVAAAISDPTSRTSQKFIRKITRLVSLAGKDKPWSRAERASRTVINLGVCARHGLPSHFYTVSADDVHQYQTLRLSVPSASNNGFPAFAGNRIEEAAEVQLFVQAVRTESNYNGHAFQESALQRQAATNPVATAIFHHQLLTSVHENLMGLPGTNKNIFFIILLVLF